MLAEPKEANPTTIFAIVALSVVVALLDLAEMANWIDTLLEVSLQLACCATMTALTVPVLRRSELPGSRKLLFAAVFLVGLSLAAWNVLEEIPQFGDSQIAGATAIGTKVAERAAGSFWSLLPIMMIVLYLREYARNQSRLEATVEERTRELSATNHSLQKEICERLLASNERDQARQELEQTLAETPLPMQGPGRAWVRQERLAAIDQAFSGLSHELNNSLMPVLSYTNLLLSKASLPPEQAQWLHNLSYSAREAAAVVRNLRHFYQNAKGEPFAPISLSSVAERAIETMEAFCDNPLPNGKQIRLETDFGSNTTIEGHQGQMQQVMTNLLSNSIEAIEEKGVIGVRTRRVGQYVNFEISDNGRGMTPTQLKCCFEPFFSTKKTRTGLGLSVCHRIVQRHGGSIDVSKVSPQGTKISVRIPASIEPPEIQTSPSEDADLADLKLLLVEDNATVRQSMTDMLELVGVNVTAVETGMQAIEVLRSDDFDAVLTDLGLPEMDGVELISEIRSFSAVPTILMSGWPRNKIMDRLKDRPQPNTILSKPTKFADLTHTIEQVAGRKVPSPTTD